VAAGHLNPAVLVFLSCVCVRPVSLQTHIRYVVSSPHLKPGGRHTAPLAAPVATEAVAGPVYICMHIYMNLGCRTRILVIGMVQVPRALVG